MIKKKLALIMAVLMLLGSCGSALAFKSDNHTERSGGEVAFAVSSVSGVHPGETVSISVFIDSAENTLHGLVSHLYFDPGFLSIESVRRGAVLEDGPEGALVTIDHRTHPGELTFCVICPQEGFSGSGELFSVSFAVSEDCAEDQFLHFAADEVYNMPLEESTPVYYDAHVTDGSISMAEDETTYGLAAGFCFETDPAEDGWSFVDLDGDSMNWYWRVFDPERDTEDPAYEGVGLIESDSRVNAALYPDNVALSPEIEIPEGAVLVFHARGLEEGHAAEHFAVMAGETEDPSEMMVLMEAETGAEYAEYRCDLNEFAGLNIHIAFRHFDSSNVSGILIDAAEIITHETVTVTYSGAYTGTQQVLYGRDAELPVLSADGIHYTFTADGLPWDGKNLRESVFVKVGLEPDIYTVDFFDPIDGAVISSQAVGYYESASAPEAPEHYGYTFAGWDKEFEHVQGDMTVNAVYEPIVFTVTYVGEYSGTQEAPYGSAVELPAYPGEGFHYVFLVDGEAWDGAFISGDTIVEVAAEPDIHTVTFILDGDIYEVRSFPYGSTISAPKVQAVGFVFSGWKLSSGASLPSTMPAEDITAFGVLNISYCIVTYTGAYNGTALVAYGSDAELPVCKTEGEHFAFALNGEPWYGICVTKSVTVTVTTEPDAFTVVFIDPIDEKAISEQIVIYGGAADAPEAPEHEHYSFVGWDTGFDCIKSDTVVKAIYEGEPVAVVFTDGMGGILAEITVPYGSAAEPPEAPVNPGWDFVGWDADISVIEQEMTVNALWEESHPTVTFTGVYTDEVTVDYGGSVELPVLDSETLHYTFTVNGESWDGTNITEDVTVTVGVAINALTFFTVTFVDWDGSVIKTETVSYGKAAEAPADPSRAGYDFIGWDCGFSHITSDLEVKALYEKQENVTIGDVDCDGDVDFDDVTLLNAYLLNAAEISDEGLANANVNGDNKISSADVVALNKLILGTH